MKEKINVGIIGACASRDAFNTLITPDYKEIFNVSCYDFQMSFPSLMSKQIKYDSFQLNKDIAKLGVAEQRHLIEDLTKHFLNDLYYKQPNLLIIDFYEDVNFGFIELENSYISNKVFKYKTVNYMNKLEYGKSYSARKNFDEFFPLWQKYMDLFMAFCKEYIPNTLIVLNTIRLSSYYWDDVRKELLLIDKNHTPELMSEINQKLKLCEDWFASMYKVPVIDYAGKEYYGNPNHLFGLDHLHFKENYYRDFLWKLLAICVENKIETKRNIVENCQLLQNGRFDYGVNSWTPKSDKWYVEKYTNENVLTIDSEAEKVDKNYQIWSLPIDVEGGEYTISFDIFSDSWEKIDSKGLFFCIRTFDKRESYDKKDSRWEKLLNKKDYNLKNNQWNHIEITIGPEGKFLKVAPYMSRNGHISYRNLYVSKGVEKEVIWSPCLNEI